MIKQNPGITETEARKFLGGFNMSGDRVFDKVGNFSGGEKARLALALLVYKAPNMLLLDEPTNHLDIQMREALILALHNYSGAVILVSHDRYFVNSVVEGLWLVAKGGVSEFTGNLDDYQRMVLAGEVQKQSSPSPKSKPSVVTPKAAALNSQQLKKLETEIAGLEKKKKLLLARLADTDLYQEKNKEKLQQLQTEYQHVESTLEKLEADWLRQTE